jgi:hypothetical protein
MGVDVTDIDALVDKAKMLVSDSDWSRCRDALAECLSAINSQAAEIARLTDLVADLEIAMSIAAKADRACIDERDDLLQHARAMSDPLEGLCGGLDWNNGTHAKIYRTKLVEAGVAFRAWEAEHGKAKE